jgi:hypothetical protein
MSIFNSVFYVMLAFVPVATNAVDNDSTVVDARYIGTWAGNWLEGMSSGKATLQVKETSGELMFTALPSFGTQPTPITKMVGSEKRLGFQTVGADGRVMRFDLKPSGDYEKLKGKAYYDSLHMEVELTRIP